MNEIKPWITEEMTDVKERCPPNEVRGFLGALYGEYVNVDDEDFDQTAADKAKSLCRGYIQSWIEKDILPLFFDDEKLLQNLTEFLWMHKNNDGLIEKMIVWFSERSCISTACTNRYCVVLT